MTRSDRDRIFISYRRTDSASEAGRLRDALDAEFGASRVFQDVNMRPGSPFPELLQSELDRAAVLLVVVADGWLAASDEHHRRHIDEPTDWVRHEIVSGLEAGILVVPVLINNATMPSAEGLPSDVADLAARQCHHLRADTWAHDLIPLFASIRESTRWSLDRSDRPRSGRLFGSRPPVVRDFVEREQTALLTGTGAQVVSALHGIGGVGKSQLAARFFRDHQAEYDFAAWIEMRDRDGLTDYGSIATAFGLDISSGELAKVVRNTIEGNTSRSWLMVFDNAERPEQVVPLLPDGGHIKVLITSRYRSWSHFGQLVDVDVFPTHVATRYLSDRAARPNDPDARRLADALGRHPLALSLAAALCNEQSLSFATFSDSRLPAGLQMSLKPDEPTTYDRAIDALWAESIDSVATRDPFAVGLVRALALLDWMVIDRAWLRCSGIAQPDDVDRCLGVLAAHSLIDLTDRTAAVKHNLIATGLAETALPQQVARLLVNLFDEAVSEPSPEARIEAAVAEPIRHLRRLLNDHADLIPVQLITSLLRAAEQLNYQGEQTATFHEALVHFCQARLEHDDTRTLDALSHLAWHYWQAGQPNKAIAIGEKVLTDRTRILGPEHPDTLSIRANLALSYWEAGRVNEAIAAGEQVLADRTRILGPEHPDTLTTRDNLALGYRTVGRVNDAITIEEQVLADRTRILGPEHPNTLTTRANLATSYREAGRVNKAIAIGEKVLADQTRILGPEHPNTISTRANLATSYREAGRVNVAIAAGEQVLADQTRILGPEHPDTISTRAGLARSYRSAGRHEDADRVLAEDTPGR